MGAKAVAELMLEVDGNGDGFIDFKAPSVGSIRRSKRSGGPKAPGRVEGLWPAFEELRE